VARLLVYLYTKSYPVLGKRKWLDLDNEHYDAYRKKLAFMLQGKSSDGDIPKASLCVELAVRELAEKYMVPKLEELSREAYQTLVKRNGQSHEATQQFIASIRTIYKTTKASDTLRNYVVYTTQSRYRKTPSFRVFQDLVRSEGEFAWDFASKGMAKSWIWCYYCQAAVDLPQELCQCGMMGYCVKSVFCGKWKQLTCPGCRKTGACAGEEPVEPHEAAQPQAPYSLKTDIDNWVARRST
jgi:hypothetical protein